MICIRGPLVAICCWAVWLCWEVPGSKKQDFLLAATLLSVIYLSLRLSRISSMEFGRRRGRTSRKRLRRPRAHTSTRPKESLPELVRNFTCQFIMFFLQNLLTCLRKVYRLPWPENSRKGNIGEREAGTCETQSTHPKITFDAGTKVR